MKLATITAAAGLVLLSACDPPYEPCKGKKCGDWCNPCGPDDTFCVNFSTNQCQNNGDCTLHTPVCK